MFNIVNVCRSKFMWSCFEKFCAPGQSLEVCRASDNNKADIHIGQSSVLPGIPVSSFLRNKIWTLSLENQVRLFHRKTSSHALTHQNRGSDLICQKWRKKNIVWKRINELKRMALYPVNDFRELVIESNFKIRFVSFIGKQAVTRWHIKIADPTWSVKNGEKKILCEKELMTWKEWHYIQ